MPSSIDFLPDQALIQASKGGAPGVPQWLALATLSKRNNERASAPVPQPQGTVAGDVISQALKGIGLTPQASPQMPQQSPTNAPQATGIMPPTQSTGMAKGGIVHYDEGGQVDQPDLATALQGVGLVPATPNIQSTPVTYAPRMPVDTGNLDSAMSKFQGLYGPDPGFKGELSRVDQAQAKGHQNYGVGDYLTDMVAGILGGKSVSPTANFGTALAAADAKQRNVTQQNFDNEMAGSKERSAIQSKMFDRQKAIVSSAEDYHKTNTLLADAQDAKAAAVAEGNAQRAQQAQEKIAELENQRASHLSNAIKLFSDPASASLVAKYAANQGNAPLAKFAQDSSDAANAQLQKDADRKKQEAVDLQNLTFSHEKSLKGIEHGYKLAEIAAQNGLGSDGALGVGYNSVKLPDGTVGQVHNGFGSKDFSSEVGDLKGVDPSNPIHTAAVHFLATGELSGKGNAMKGLNQATLGAAQSIMQANNITPEQVEQARQIRKSSQKSLTDLTTKNMMLQDSENKIERQFDNASRAIAKGNTTGIPLIDGPLNAIGGKLGGNAAADLDTAITPIANEYAKFMSGNGANSDASRAHAHELLATASNKEQFRVRLDNLRNEMKQQVGGGNEDIAAAQARGKFSNILGALRTGDVNYGIKKKESEITAPKGVPGIGETFNGGKVLKVTKIE